ncbi:MAG: AIPR family protein [Candidatus Thermoplasmatota archaeon]|nr:AIPR family protein [Candidatus Thermoplasmatota archaeon]
MSNKELFISTYLDKIAGKFDINKDQAFEIFSIAAILDKTFDEIYADVIIPGAADGGIDGIYFDEQDGFYTMEVFQCKNSKKLSQNQLEKLKQDFAEVFEKGRRDKPNTEGLMPELDEYISITKKGYYIEHRLNFIFNGDVHDKNYAANKDLFESYNNPANNFLIFDSNELDKRIDDLIKSDSKRKEVKYTFTAQKSNVSPKEPQALISFSILNVKAVNFRMKTLELCELVDLEIKTNGTEDKLFSENIRGFLGYNKTNRKIKDTLNNNSESIYFPFLNNGITILCDEMQMPSNPQAGQYIVPVVNPVIVNGLQTTKVVYDTYNEDRTKLDGVDITVRLYETKDPNLVNKITEATNTQTSINFRDKISNKHFQKYVKLLFENKGVAYISKRGEIFTNQLSKDMHDSITSEKAIKFWYATYYEKPEMAKNSVSEVLEEVFDATNQENPLATLFDGAKNSSVYLQIYNSYLIMKQVVEMKKNRSDTDDFLEHSDELLSYGVYKYLMTNQSDFSQNDIEDGYKYAVDIVRKNVLDEKDRREQTGVTYSHSSYFKSAQCRIDYNKVAGISETYNLVEKLIDKRIGVI